MCESTFETEINGLLKRHFRESGRVLPMDGLAGSKREDTGPTRKERGDQKGASAQKTTQGQKRKGRIRVISELHRRGDQCQEGNIKPITLFFIIYNRTMDDFMS